MSQPIGPSNQSAQEQPSCNAVKGFFQIITKGLDKAFTPCDEYCNKSTEEFKQRCIQECKNFQQRAPY